MCSISPNLNMLAILPHSDFLTGVTTMCRAIEKMRNDTEFKTRLADIRNMVETFNLTVVDVLKAMKIPESEHERYIPAL